MKCNYCGCENETDFTYCPNCGCSAQELNIARNTAADTILSALKDKLFLVICILITASAGAGILMGSVPLLNVLMTIFLWLTFAQARKDIADARHLRQVSGTVFATYVINYVLAGLVVACGALVAAAFGMIASMPGFLETLFDELAAIDNSFAFSGKDLAGLSSAVMSASGTVILIIFAILGGIIALYNAFSLRYIHRFAKSGYQSIEKGTLELEHAGTTFGWLIAFAVFSGISALGSLTSMNLLSAISEGSLCAVYIVSAIWLKKYFPASK